MDLDSSSNLFVTGHVENGLEGSNIVTLKYNQYGTLQWTTQYHASMNDFGHKTECDNAGNVYTLGSIQTGIGTYATVLVKYNATGVQQWVYIVSLGTSNTPTDLLAKSGGNIYVLSDNVISGQHDAVISVINTSGSLVNQQTYNSGYEDTPINFEFRAGKILLGVSTNNTGVITSSVINYDPVLSPTWTYGFSGSGLDDLKSVKFDNDGDVAVLVSVDSLKNAEVTKISSTGSFLWELVLDDDNEFHTDQSLCIDSSNNIIVAYAHKGESEISVTIINPLGEKLWNKYYYGNSVDYERVGIVSDDARIICAASEISISDGNLLAFSLAYDGTFQWENREKSGFNGRLSDFDINTNSHIVLTGQAEAVGTSLKIALVDLAEKAAYDAPDESGSSSGSLAYFQNLGRINDLDGNTVDGLSYAGVYGDEALYFFDNSIAFTHYKTDFDEATVDSIYRLDFLFTGHVNPKNPTGINPVNYHNNYYTANLKRERVNGYKKIVYPNLYKKIDLEIGENEFGPVFSFIIHPGADIGAIEWEVDGATELYGGYLDSTIIADFKQFSTPLLYTEDLLGDPVAIPYDTTAYGYDIDSTGKIVLDFPTMVNTTSSPIIVQLNRKGTHRDRSPDDNFNWCSYIRNPGTESFVGTGVIAKITSDAANNTYYAGSVYKKDASAGAFPTTTGIYEFPIGENDITIMKLNDDIEIQWASYYGGTSSDKALSIATNVSGSTVYLTGSSSSSDFPVVGAPGAYVESTGESFVMELNADGTINWATKFPAELLDCELVNGNLFVVGARIDPSTPTLMDDGSNYYSANGSGYLGVFQPGGYYIHGTGFGKTGTGFGTSTKITGIDWILDSGGAANIALTGQTKESDFLVVNAPADHDTYLGGGGDYYNAFISNLTTLGTIKFSHYISSVETSGFGGIFVEDDYFYFATGDRGNDVKFSPDGQSVYVVGEAFGDDLEVTSTTNPDDYEQSVKFTAALGFAFRPAGFIYRADNSLGNEGDKLLCTYFAPSSTDESYYGLYTRLSEISFDDLGNYYISGYMLSSSVEDTPIPAEYNVPLPYTQPIGFYQESVPTYSPLECVGGLDRESYIIALNADDEHIWTTYVGGGRDDQIKPMEVTSNRLLYFGGTTVTSNGGLPALCIDATPDEIITIEFPIWEYDITLGSLDWFEPNGGGDQCEFAGRFDVNGVNDPGPPLSIQENETENRLSIYPNPNAIGDLFISLNGRSINRVVIYAVDGKIVEDIRQTNLTSVNIAKLNKGTYIIECQTNETSYKSKFVKN